MQTSLWHKAILFLGVFLVVFALLGEGRIVQPAYAQGVTVSDKMALSARIKQWAEDHANLLEDLGYLGKMIKGITSAVEFFAEKMEALMGWVEKNSFTKLMSKRAAIKAEAKITDAKNNARAGQTFTEVAMEVRSKFTPPRNEHLCKLIRSYQLSTTTTEFEQSVACLALSGIDNLYRGEKDDGSGPKYAVDMIKLRCALKLGSKLDGFPEDCIDDSTVGPNGEKLADADLSFPGDQILELPAFKDKSIDGVTYSLPDPKNAEQKFWVAKWYYCIQLAGPRPTPPRKMKIAESDKTGKRALFDHGLVMSSIASWPCVLKLAYNTRPNDTASKLRESQNTMCSSAVAAGIKLDKSYGDCKSGVSSFQRQEIEMAICLSNQNYIAYAMGGASHPEMMAAVTNCDRLIQAIASQRATRKTALTRASSAAAKLRTYWSKVGR